MNTQFFKWLLTVTVSFCVIFVAANATAKKPVKPTPEPPDDPCLSAESFSPDHVFYRDTGTRKDPRVTILLAESVTGCEKVLVDFSVLDVDGSRIDVRYLKYSSVIEQNDTFGRVIWLSRQTSREEILSYDFYISGADLIPDNGIRSILANEDNWNQGMNDFDLSPDATMLAFKFYKRDPATGEHVYNLRMIDIGHCHALPFGCSVDDERALVLAETSPEVDFDHVVADPAWGPWGERIYFLRSEDGVKILQFAQLDDGWEYPEWPPSFVTQDLFSSETEPEFRLMRNIASGLMNGREYLAVEFPNQEKTNCGYIYFITVEDCEREENPVCFTDLEFAGTHPSWSRDGKVIHHYEDAKVNRAACSVYGGMVGVYDGINLDTLSDGFGDFYPDGAGGLPQ